MITNRFSSTADGLKAGGPYSIGVVAEGKFLFVSGQGPYCPERKCFVLGSVEEQTRMTLRNVQRVIEAAGGDIKNVVSARVYLQMHTEKTWNEMNKAFEEFFGEHKPVRTTIGAQLLNIDVEIDVMVAM
jgi:2-iminobutanoate/2-iminopropanoate deaminase